MERVAGEEVVREGSNVLNTGSRGADGEDVDECEGGGGSRYQAEARALSAGERVSLVSGDSGSVS